MVIGRDTRISGHLLEQALAAGFCAMGVDVELLGVLPTPGVAYQVRKRKAIAGAVISASHNPFEDNGIKFFCSSGGKLTDEEEAHIEAAFEADTLEADSPVGGEVGRVLENPDAAKDYVAFCLLSFPAGRALTGLKVVLDCGHGATCRVAPEVFYHLGADVTVLNYAPDGTNINAGCGSQHTAGLAAKVTELGAQVGLAFDGDGDRLIAVDEQGNELTGDHILVICAKWMKEHDQLAGNLLISTVMSNFGMRVALRELGVEHEMAGVGDRQVLQRLHERGAVLGGEASGHLIFLDHHSTGDGLIASLQLMAAMQDLKQPLSRLAQLMQMAPQVLINMDVARKPPIEEEPEIGSAIRAAEQELGDSGRVLIRYSGTQNMCRVMVEGPTEEMTRRLAESLADKVRTVLG